MFRYLLTAWLALLAIVNLANAFSSRIANCYAQSLTRVQNVQTPQGWSVRAGNGSLLRGVAIAVFEFQRASGKDGHLRDPAFWQAMQNQGLNAVRLVVFDPWQRSHALPGSTIPFPFSDFSNSADMAETLTAIDQVVAMAASRNIYVLINYHDTGGYLDPDHSKPANAKGQFPYLRTMLNLRRFWRNVAPRYANQPHVFYELANEPVQWFSFHYTDRDLANFKSIYDDIRARAPLTHIVLCSFANTTANGQQSMLDVARKTQALGIPFNNESIGFHPYNSNFPRRNTRAELDALRLEYPVINTEQNFPIGVVAGSIDPDASGYDGDRFGVQSMERMGISWFHWKSSDPQEFQGNFVKRIIFDAKRKGYFWVP